MKKLKQYLDDIAAVFGYKYNEEFFSYLKDISKPNNQVCNKEISRGEGGWKCLDCELDPLSLICNDCITKCGDIHKGHKLTFNPNTYGFCDCGDPTVYNKECFCSDHQGTFTNKTDLMNFIKLSIDENLLNNINNILNKIFQQFIIIEKMRYDNNKNDEDITIEEELFNMIDELSSFILNLYNNNLQLFFFVILKFTENFPYETNHKCFNYNEQKKITIIKEEYSQKHICICPFFQVLLNILYTKKTNHDSESFYSLFIQNYLNRLSTSLSYFFSFPKLFDNDNLKKFSELGYQLLTDDLADLVYDEKNKEILKDFHIEVYNKIKEYIEKKEYNKASNIIYRLYCIVKYLPKLSMINQITSNINIFVVLIDITNLINNLNVFENKIKFTSFQRDGLCYDLLDYELFGLLISNLISYLVDFDNLEKVKIIFSKLITKIQEYKRFKENLPDKTFTPHIVCIRNYSIFLNRFCFSYSIKNNCDLLNSFQYFQSIIPESKDINKFVFLELINFFGFLLSMKYGFFSYYGEDMDFYYENYFSYRIYMHSDITLMKYLLTLPEIESEFDIDKILNYSNIDSSNNFFLNLKNEDLNNKNKDLSEKIKEQEKNLKYINSIFELLLLIIRDNFIMTNLLFKFNNFRMNYNDTIFEYLLINEKINFENIIKNRIIHSILGKKNLVKREDIKELYESINKKLDIKLVDNLLKNDCELISSSNQLKKFSLKKNIFPICDIDYIIDYDERINAIKYLTDFQSNDFNLLNTYIDKSLKIQEKLYKKAYETFFNEIMFDKLINFYNALISNNNYPLLTDIFFFTLSKIICVFIKLYKDDKKFEKYQNRLNDIIKNNKLEGNNEKLIQYIKELLNEGIKNDEQKKNVLDKKKNFKEKYKKKFNEKIQLVLNKYSSSEIDINIDDTMTSENEEICVYCRQSLNNDLSDYYGKICYLFTDYFIDTLKSKEEKLRKKCRKFVTCNHKIHFNCYYNKFIINNINDGNILKNGFACPLCKKLSNIIICDFTDLIKSDNNFLKGMSYGNENLDDFYEKEDNIHKYQNFILYNNNFFEGYCSKLLKKEVLIKDITDIVIDEIYKYIVNDFDTFIIYYNTTNYKKEQINIWKNVLFTIRLLCKYRLINATTYFSSKFQLIYKNIINLNFNYFNDIEISSFINEFIICLFILYDLNKENKEKIKNIFENYILLYMFTYSFLKSKENDLDEYLNKKENIDSFKKVFELYELKYKICFLLYDEEESLNFEDIIKSLKTNKNLKDLINKANNIFLNEQNLEIPKFKLINLPDTFIELISKYMNINCVNCHKKNSSFYICLNCGEKICDVTSCLTELKPNGMKDYSLIDHSKKCSGGNSIFISNKNSEIIYILKRRIISSGIFVYLNSFGECVNEDYTNESYILNKVELEKAIQMYIDMTFRKKKFKINSING